MKLQQPTDSGVTTNRGWLRLLEAPTTNAAHRGLALALLVLALLIVGLVVAPAGIWRHPTNGVTYDGFDSNLMFVSPSGPGDVAGTVGVSQRTLTITALPGSHPTIHLITTPLSFSAAFDLEVTADSPNAVPLRLGIWSPATRAGYFLVFDRDAGQVIRAETIVSGSPRQDLVAGQVRESRVLGQFATGQSYHVTLSVDRLNRTIDAHIVGQGARPGGSHALRVGSALSGATVVNSAPIPVTSGSGYSFGGWVSRVAAPSTYAIGVLWFDQADRPLPSNNDQWWRQRPDQSGWTRKEASVIAPTRAAYARMFLGAGPASTYMFGGMFFQDSGSGAPNLVSNSLFDSGLSGWQQASGGANSLAIADLTPSDVVASASAHDVPEVFDAFRPTLTLDASSDAGIVKATVSNYVLTLPVQPAAAAEQTVQVDDELARRLVKVLLIAATFLCLLRCIQWIRLHMTLASVMKSFGRNGPDQSSIRTSTVVLLGAAFGLYLLVNMLLFPLGSPHFDVLGAKIWSYIAFKDGISELYYRPLLVPAAAAWQGVPWHEAVFPYGFTSAYYSLAVGWISRLWLSPGGSVVTDTYALEILLKAFNVVFALADCVLIYSIVKRLGNERKAWQAAVIFVLNPAVLIVMSIWGSTETISLFFILGSIWLAEKKNPLGAWLMLAAGAFTRPQMLVLAFFLSAIYLRKFGVIRSLQPLAWTVVVSFIFLAPFAVAISPSVPVDYVSRTLGFSLGGGQVDPNFLGLSPANYSVWSLVLGFVGGKHGMERMWSPSTDILYGTLTYGHLANILSVTLVLVIGAALLAFKRLSARPEQYLPIVAFGMLGWLLVTPGVISRYFVYSLVLVILCRNSFGTVMYGFVVGALTVITFVTSYGHLALDFLGYGAVANVFHPTNNAISQSVYALFTNDRFITAGAVANIIVLVLLGIRATRSVPPDREPETETDSGKLIYSAQ